MQCNNILFTISQGQKNKSHIIFSKFPQKVYYKIQYTFSIKIILKILQHEKVTYLKKKRVGKIIVKYYSHWQQSQDRIKMPNITLNKTII